MINTAKSGRNSLSFILWSVLILSCRHDNGTVTIGRVEAFLTSSLATPKERPMKPNESPVNSKSVVSLEAAPQRLSDNAQGPLYVNDRCINCSACSMFAPSVFARDMKRDTHHFVTKQPVTELEIEDSRAALAACPVAAIRVEHNPIIHEELPSASQFAIRPSLNGRPLPFPRLVSSSVPDVHFVGHHNPRSFGAAPYLFSVPTYFSESEPTWVLVDTPAYSKRAVEVVESLTGLDGPSYLVLTHVDDTADHNRWKERFPNMKRVFHAGDLGKNNWVGDDTLENVEILLDSRSSDNQLQHFDLNGTPIDSDNSEPVVLIHTPGHTPGCISILKKPTNSGTPGVLFTGDTYTYTTRDGGHGSGMPQYSKENFELQANILRLLLDLDWQVLAPGHGHARDYSLLTGDSLSDLREAEIEEGIEELSRYF